MKSPGERKEKCSGDDTERNDDLTLLRGLGDAGGGEPG
jgi:hypothetical protein